MRKRKSGNTPRRNEPDYIDYGQSNSFFSHNANRCPDKRTYDTLQDAEFVAGRNSNKSGRRIGAYQCPVCGYFHLTSNSKSD